MPGVAKIPLWRVMVSPIATQIPPLRTTPLDSTYYLRYSVRHLLYAVRYKRWTRRVNDDVLDNLRLELRRGCLIVAVLAQLRAEYYGYALRKALADQGMDIDENTLYPLLRRLESQGLLVSTWREENKRNKRFYRLSDEGQAILGQLLEEWNAIDTALNRIVRDALPLDLER